MPDPDTDQQPTPRSPTEQASLRSFLAARSDAPTASILADLRREVEAHPDSPAWARELARRQLRAEAPDDARRTLQAALERVPEHAGLLTELARVEMSAGHPDAALEAIETALARSPADTGATSLWLQVVTRLEGAAAANRIALQRMEQGDGLTFNGHAIARLADWLIDDERPSAAAELIERSDVRGDEARPLVLLVAARAAVRLGDQRTARRLLTEAVLSFVPAALLRSTTAVLADLLLPDAGASVIDRILVGLDDAPARIRQHAEQRLRVSGGTAEQEIEALAPGGRVIETSPWVLHALLHAANDLGRPDLMRSVLDQFGDLPGMSAAALREVIRVASSLDDPEVTARLSGMMLERMGDSDDAEALVAAAEHARAIGDADAVAARLVAHDRAGRTDATLAYYLALHGEDLRSHVSDPGTASELAGLLERAPRILDTHANLDAVRRERHYARMMLRIMGRAERAPVSVLIPMHRAEDVPNVRRSISAQSWPDLEVLVLPNGPLAGSPLVRTELADLPNVRLIDGASGTIGTILNAGIAEAGGRYILRFDADDVYLPDYVTNLVSTMAATDADVAYKPSFFVDVRQLDRVVYHVVRDAWIDRAGGTGATQAFRADVLREHRYAESLVRSEDNRLCRAIAGAGGRVVTADPFDVVVTRYADKHRHTWRLPDVHMYGERMLVGDRSVIAELGNPAFEPDR